MAESGIRISGDGIDVAALLEAHIKEVLRIFLEKSGEFLIERAQQNAPIKSGDLRASMLPVMEEEGDAVFEVLLQATESYALRMHEELTPAGHLQLGPGSRAAAAQPIPEGGPGGKYFSRVVEFHLVKIQEHLGRAIEENWPGVLRGSVSVTNINL